VGLCVCLSVCLSARISPEPHARSLPNFLCTLPMSVARSSSDTFTIGCIAYRWEGVFFLIDNAHISGTTHAIFTKFLCMLPMCVVPMSVARSSSDMLTIGCIAYRQDGVFFPLKMHYRPGKGDESAQRGRNMLYAIAVFKM